MDKKGDKAAAVSLSRGGLGCRTNIILHARPIGIIAYDIMAANHFAGRRTGGARIA